ncbi:M57 family metalloprotease [Chitinophaga sp. 22536]|uniref:M57 family metalloprotease n=1 Tax=unclassified Chitinophaga TaxID=2619133 RepID=UPI003F847679
MLHPIRLFRTVLCLFVVVSVLVSCKKENAPDDAGSKPSNELLQKIKAAGYSTNGIIKVDGGYIVEGDIFINEREIDRQVTSSRIRIAQSEQYRTNNLISIPGGQREITISVTNLPPAYVAAADEAIKRYNDLNLRLTFRRVASGGNVDVQNANLGTGVLGRSAGFPDAQGNPPSPILLNAGYIGSSPDPGFLATLFAHEIGHTIGLRHTDYFNRSYSCGFSNPNNEGDAGVGAINIPGTPTAEDPNSWMLACTSTTTNRPFNTNDRIALQALYGTPPEVGIGGYDLLSQRDLSFAFDYTSSGKADHLVLYRPGDGVLYILKNNGGNFTQAFASHQGIAGYNLMSADDRVIPFDYTSSGKADHLLLYRPGQGVIYILKNDNGNFSQVYASHQGIAGYNLMSVKDQIIAFDYNHSGKADHLALYRPGDGVLYILKNDNGNFSQVWASHSGIAGYDLRSNDDKIVAFDYTGTGKADHLALYRPGQGVLYIEQNVNGTFSEVFSSHSGVATYDLQSATDRLFPYDYTNSGKQDHLALYRPGQGVLYVIKNTNGTFQTVYSTQQGLGGYNLQSTDDKVFPFDYLSNSKNGHLVLYRPGAGVLYILQNNSGNFTRVR